MKKLISALLLAAMLITFIPVIALNASAETKTELAVVWNSGFVGSATNSSYKNSLSGESAGWKYTDIITVPTAGTKISFALSASFPSNSVWLFSEWKQSGTNWVMDLAGANVVGVSSNEYVGQKKDGSSMNYEYITDHANQSVRICLPSMTEMPTIFTETTTDKSTKQQLADLEFTATLANDGKVTDLKWFSGYASSASNTNGSAKECKYYQVEYAFSNLFTVPNAGTKITYTITQASNTAFNSFTRYKLVNGVYTYDIGFNANDTMVRSGTGTYTYTYITEYANEILRIGVRPQQNYSSIYVSEPVSVSWEATSEAGTATKIVDPSTLKTEWPDPELLSLVTGAPLIGNEVTGLKWVNGYIGSQYQDNPGIRLVYTSPTNKYYYTSDAFNVPKAGTTVYFFDQTFTDYEGGLYSSTSVIALAHWTQTGAATVGTLDETKPYFTGCEIYQIPLTEKYRAFAYTTTEDNEIIRLCMRYLPQYAAEDALIPPVYLVEPTDFDAEQPESTVASATAANAKLFDGSYTDLGGTTVNYKYYLPYGGGTANGQYSLVFDNSADGAVAQYLATNLVKNSIVISYNGSIELALRLLDEVIAHYPVKVSDLLFVGGDELAAHAKKFEGIRLCQAFLYTGSGTLPTFEYATSQALGSSVETSAKWLIGEYDNYYDVLDGLTMYAIGDSYFGGSGLGQHQTWVNLMGYKYGMTFHNYGIGGNHVAIVSGNEGNSPSMCTRYEEMPNGGDIYLLEGGRNDRHHSVPFGNVTDNQGTTFMGAFNIMIAAIRKNNPNALIVLVTPWSYTSEGKSSYIGTNNDYADAIKELVDYYNDPHIVCLYAADTEYTGIDMSIVACRTEYCLTTSDVSHLNANGMYMVLPKFDKWIANKYAALNNLTVSNDAKDSEQFLTLIDDGNSEETTTTSTTTNTPTGDSNCSSCSGFTIAAQFIALFCGSIAVVIIRKKK